MSFRSRALRGTAVALSLYLAGCNSATAPASLVDPLTTAAQAAALDSAFSAPVISSYQSLSSSIQMAPPIVRPSLGAVGLVPRIGPGGSRYAALAALGRGYQQFVPGFASLATSGVFPDSLLGSVFTWNTGTGSYQRDSTTGGPINGVRFWLYAINPLTDQPATPLTPVGFADLLDESSGGAAQVRVRVKDGGGVTTYLDYTFTGSGSSSAFSASVSGTVTNGLGGGANKTLAFNATITGNTSSVTLTTTYTLNHPAVTVSETLSISDNGGTTTLTVGFTFSRPGETISISGIITISDADGSVTVNVTIKVNGASYASLNGSTLTRAGGGQLTAGEQLAVARLVDVAANMSERVGEIFSPAERMLGL